MTVVAHQVIDYLQTQTEMLVAEVGNEGKNKIQEESSSHGSKLASFSLYFFFPQ